MALTDAQKRAKEKYSKSNKGVKAQMKSNALTFIRHKATKEDLKEILKEIEIILKEKCWHTT